MKILLLTIGLIAIHSVSAQELEEKEGYIPKNLDDAVRVLMAAVSPKDLAMVRRGEIEAGNLHFGMGMGIRNGWGLWAGSRLAGYFHQSGIHHPDDMSNYILEVLFQRVKGQEDYGLLDAVRKTDAEGRVFHYPIFEGRRYSGAKRQAILYQRKDYAKDRIIRATRLLWHPDNGKIYLKVSDPNGASREATNDEIAKLRQDKEWWLFTEAEIETLDRLRLLSPDERLSELKNMSEDVRFKLDGVLPRSTDPDGIDKDLDDFKYRFESFATGESYQVDPEEVLLGYKLSTIEFTETPFIDGLHFLQYKATESLWNRTYFVGHVVDFEYSYDRKQLDGRLINYIGDDVLLRQPLSEVLGQVGLTFKVVTDKLIRVYPKNKAIEEIDDWVKIQNNSMLPKPVKEN